MKNLSMTIRATAQQDLTDLFRDLEQVQSFTFSHVEGHGAQMEHDLFLSERDKVVGYVQRIRVDVLLEDVDVEVVLTAIINRGSGLSGQGNYWVTTVEKYGQL